MKATIGTTPGGVNHIQGLDGLRAVAIIGVVLYHLCPNIIHGGFLGVSLFLVLSGYLMMITSEKSWENEKFGVLYFYKKRLKRIFPALVIVVLFILSFMTIYYRNELSGIRSELASIFGGYNNWWQISKNSSYFSRLANDSPFTHIWSLSVEMQFYLIWPFIFLLYKFIEERGVKVVPGLIFAYGAVISFLVMFFLYKPGTDPSRIYYGTDTRSSAIFLGALVGVLQLKRNERIKSVGNKVFLIALFCLSMAVICYSYLFMDGQGTFTYRGGMFLVSIVFCIVIGIATNKKLKIGTILDFHPLSWIGKRSYEIYLWQYPVTFLYGKIYGETNKFYHIFIQLVIILVLSALTYEYLMMTKSKIRTYLSGAVLLMMTGICSFGVLTAPLDKMSADQKQLQLELKQNQQALMEEKENQTTSETFKPAEQISEFTAIGDSVMLGAFPALKETFPEAVIDAAESRQMWDFPEILERLRSQSKLLDTVVIALGTNGIFRESNVQGYIDELGSDRIVYFVTAYGKSLSYKDTVNSVIKSLAEKNKNVHVIEWSEFAKDHPDWFYDDGIHLNSEGQKGYADFIRNSLS